MADPAEMYFDMFQLFPHKEIIFLEIIPEEMITFLKGKQWFDSDNFVYYKTFNKRINSYDIWEYLIQLPKNVFLSCTRNNHNYDPMISFLYSCKEGEKVVDEIKLFVDEKRKNVKSSTYMVSSKYSSFTLDKVILDKPRYDLNLDAHYNDDFMHYHNIILEAITENKTGLILLHGKPGTGKTTYLNNLIHQTNRNVIYLTSETASALTNPELLNDLISKKGSVLVIEDADEVIMDRTNSVVANVTSALLNITDGILSQLLSMTVICTFNTDILKIDTALLRKGRLICRYEFHELSKEKTEAIVGKAVKHGLTLTDAINYESENFEQEHKKIGFN
jgi:hypothetical protein